MELKTRQRPSASLGGGGLIMTQRAAVSAGAVSNKAQHRFVCGVCPLHAGVLRAHSVSPCRLVRWFLRRQMAFRFEVTVVPTSAAHAALSPQKGQQKAPDHIPS
jgi:hypothetical protein